MFPQIFQFSPQTEKPLWAQPTREFTAPLSLGISPKPKETGSSFHQVIPARTKVFSRCKNTENGGSSGCLQWAEHDLGDKRSPSSETHCHLQASCYAILLSYKAIYKLWVRSCIFRIWPRCADTTYLQAMQDAGNSPCLQGGLGAGGKQMEREATSSPLAILEHHSRDLKTTSLFLQSITTSAGTIQYWIVALQAQ